MLRACHEVLRPHGRIAGYTICVPGGLTGAQRRRASELGPGEVLAEAPLRDLFGQAGFRVTLEEDVTEDFRVTCEAIVRARRELEAELRGEEGDAVFEDELEKKMSTLQGASEGLLQRSLLVASKR